MVQQEEVTWQAYTVVLGQCSQTVHDHLKAAGSWNAINHLVEFGAYNL